MRETGSGKTAKTVEKTQSCQPRKYTMHYERFYATHPHHDSLIEVYMYNGTISNPTPPTSHTSKSLQKW